MNIQEQRSWYRPAYTIGVFTPTSPIGNPRHVFLPNTGEVIRTVQDKAFYEESLNAYLARKQYLSLFERPWTRALPPFTDFVRAAALRK